MSIDINKAELVALLQMVEKVEIRGTETMELVLSLNRKLRAAAIAMRAAEEAKAAKEPSGPNGDDTAEA